MDGARTGAEPGHQDPDGESSVPHNALHPETGFPLVCARKCATCIFRPGNLMRLADGSRDELVEDTLAADVAIICHETLGIVGRTVQAVCRGFYDLHARDTLALRLALWFGQDIHWPQGHLIDPNTDSSDH